MSTLLRPYAPYERTQGCWLVAASCVCLVELTLLVEDQERLASLLVLVAVAAVITTCLSWFADRSAVRQRLPGLTVAPGAVASELSELRRASLVGGASLVVLALFMAFVLVPVPVAGPVVVIGLTFGRGVGRLGAAQVVRAHERAEGVVVCRGPGQPLAGVYVPLDLERLVAVPVGPDATVPRS